MIYKLLAALAALYLLLIDFVLVTQCHFRTWTQIVTLETWDPSDKNKKKDQKESEFNIVMAGQFCLLCFYLGS